MKKILLILWIILLTLTQVSASECSQSCKISDAPAPVLTQYISDLQSIQASIIEVLSSGDTNPDGWVSNGDEILQSMNSILSIWDFVWSFDYYITTPLFQTVPSQVKRDHELILTENKQLMELLQLLVERSQSRVNVWEICSWINNCNLDNTTAQIALTTLMNNNQQILKFYRALITDDEFITADTSFILVEDSFRSQMRDHYNASTLNACSQCAWEFWDVLEKIQDISWAFEWSANAIQDIRNSWHSLMADENISNYRAVEKELLTEYLVWEWIPTNQADIMLWNLDRANKGGWISTSNPLSNSAIELDWAINSFGQSIIKWYDELFGERETIPYSELSQINTEIQQWEDIASAIATIYENELPFVVVQDTSVQTLQARLIRMHFSLTRTSNLLFEKIPDAEEICNRQWRLLGRCQYDLILR